MKTARLYTTILSAYNAYCELFPYSAYYAGSPIWDLDTYEEYVQSLGNKFPLTDTDIKIAYSISLND